MKTRTNRKSACGPMAIGLCLCAAFAASGWADPIADPYYSLNCNGSVSYSEGQLVCDGGSASSFSSTYVGVATDFTGLGSYGYGGSGGSAQLTYDVGVTGGNVGDGVLVDVDATLFSDSLGDTGYDVTDASASVGLSFANGNYGASQTVSCGNVLRGEDCSFTQWSGTLQAIAWVGYDNFIEILASSEIAGAGYAQSSAYSRVYIDPTFAASNPEYSLELNVSNLEPSAAPEPSSWLLSITAFGLVLWSARRNASRQAAPVR